MPFREELPPQCPPVEAAEMTIPSAWRLVHSPQPTIDAFSSHAALGKARIPNVSECDHASCSLFIERERVQRLARLPKLRQGAHLAELTIPVTAGQCLVNETSSHVHLWMYRDFDPVAHIIAVTEV